MVLFVLLFGVRDSIWASPTNSWVVDYLDPPTDANFERRVGDRVMVWLARLHFGRYEGQWIQATWVVLGLAPAALFVTGVLM